MIKAIVFDFDQTLVDSAAGFRKAEKAAETKIFADLGLGSWSAFLADYRKTRAEFHAHLNFSRRMLWREVYTHYDSERSPVFLMQMEHDYWQIVKAETKPFPETRAVLEQLAAVYRLALITNTQGQATSEKHRLTLFPELEKLFDAIVMAGKADVPVKPDRRPFLICLEMLGVAPDEAVYVGDDWQVDICGAQAVGMHPIWLKHHSVSRKWPSVETSVPIITDLKQLLDLENIVVPLEDFDRVQQKYVMQCWGVQGKYEPIPVEKASGCWIYTTDGRKIFDLRSAHECINLGFRHPKVLQAMREQMETVIYVTDDFATKPAAQLAQTLAEITPGDPNKRVWLGQSGAAAVEAAIKAARFYKYNQMVKKGFATATAPHLYPYPYKIISRYRSYHGATTGAMSVSGDPRRWFIEPFTMPGVVHAPDAYCYRCPFNQTYPSCGITCAKYIDQMIELEGGSNKVAAIIVEPVVGSNGIIPPPPEYLPMLREICDKWDLLLIADETMTGFGRTGEMFAINHYNVIPDITVVGKALGAYCPLTATVFSQKVAEAFEDNLFGHGQSYSGHALASAAALASIKVLQEAGIVERTRKMGAYLGDRLTALAETHRSIGDVRGLGLFWTIELVKNRETREPFRRAMEKYIYTPVSKIADYLLQEKDIYIPADKFGIWIVPPLIVSQEEIDFVVEAIDDALKIADAETIV